MDQELSATMDEERVIVCRDLNGHIGRSREGIERIHGGWGMGDRNDEGEKIVETAMAFDFAIVNSFFEKKVNQFVTFNSGGRESQIDFLMCRRCHLKEVSGMTTGWRSPGDKETWWWNDKVQEVIEAKKVVLCAHIWDFLHRWTFRPFYAKIADHFGRPYFFHRALKPWPWRMTLTNYYQINVHTHTTQDLNPCFKRQLLDSRLANGARLLSTFTFDLTLMHDFVLWRPW